MLVFVYGLNLFFTRIAAPGTFNVLNENFNTVQLVLAVAGTGNCDYGNETYGTTETSAKALVSALTSTMIVLVPKYT